MKDEEGEKEIEKRRPEKERERERQKKKEGESESWHRKPFFWAFDKRLRYAHTDPAAGAVCRPPGPHAPHQDPRRCLRFTNSICARV